MLEYLNKITIEPTFKKIVVSH